MIENRFKWLHPAKSLSGVKDAADLISRSFPLPHEQVLHSLSQLSEADFVLRYENNEKQLGCVVCLAARLRSYYSQEQVVFLNWATLEPSVRTGAVATHFFKDIAREAAKSDAVAAFMYPVSWPLYQSLGFGLSTSWTLMAVPMATVRSGKISTDCRPVKIDHLHNELSSLPWSADERRLARRSPLLRAGMWNPTGSYPQAYIFGCEGEPTGYVVLKMEKGILEILDYTATTFDVVQNIVNLAASFGSICHTLAWVGESGDILHRAIQSLSVSILNKHHSMSRILNLTAALDGRAVKYKEKRNFNFAVCDKLIPENEIHVWLEVNDSRCKILKTSKDIDQAELKIPISSLSGMMYGNFPLLYNFNEIKSDHASKIDDINMYLEAPRLKLIEKSFF